MGLISWLLSIFKFNERQVLIKNPSNNPSRNSINNPSRNSTNNPNYGTIDKHIVSKDLRNAIWTKYIGGLSAGHCYCCNDPINYNNAWEAGHIIAWAKGGTTIVNNLRPICGPCNKSMGKNNMLDYAAIYGFSGKILREFQQYQPNYQAFNPSKRFHKRPKDMLHSQHFSGVSGRCQNCRIVYNTVDDMVPGFKQSKDIKHYYNLDNLIPLCKKCATINHRLYPLLR